LEIEIPYGRQSIDDADVEAVENVLRSNFLTQGPVVPRFEEAIAAYSGANYGVAVNSATSALHIACLAMDLGPGDWVWTSPNTFVASANCALYCGAKVDFVDIDSKSYNLCPNKLQEKLVAAEKRGVLPKIVIPVHFAGQPCDMDAISDLRKKYGFKIIEDASHAIGAHYKETRVGSCANSDITVFSFHPVKIITSGEGGMALTNQPELDRKLRLFRSHGISSDPNDFELRSTEEIWNYQQLELGLNYRMTDIHAALGLSQLRRIDDFIEKRRSIAQHYCDHLENLPLVVPWQSSESRSSFHLYPVRIPLTGRKTQRQIYERLRENRINANLHYIPVHRQPFYEAMGFRLGDFPEAERFHREVLSLPMYPGLRDDQQTRVIKLIEEELGN